MKIDLSIINTESFHVNDVVVNGELMYLVIPKEMGCVWTQENKIFRSSVWSFDGELISAGFFKFVNLGENPEVFPVPTSLKNATVMAKVDGSALIISKYKGEFIIRTRGTVDASKMEKNGHEIEIFKKEILSKLSEHDTNDTWNYSLIFEWTSKLNKIVIDYGEVPQFFFIGAVNHEDYSLWTQKLLNEYAKLLSLVRPETYTFTTLTDLVENVNLWKGREGVVIYHKNDQEIHKCKAMDYLIKHRFKSNATLENTIELFFNFDMPSYQEFETKLVEMFDWECFTMIQNFLSIICDGWKEVKEIENGLKKFVESVKSLPTRKDQALKIISSYGGEKNSRAGMVFTLLDGKPLDKNQRMKLLYQVLKK